MTELKDYWSGLLAFECAAEHGSFTLAGRQLGLTPSAISKAIGRLERRLGTQLFQRSTRSQSLTAEGRRFRDQIAPLLRGLRDAETAVGQGVSLSGQVRISAPIDIGRLLVAAWSNDFSVRHPTLGLILQVTDRLVDIWREGYDVAIRMGATVNADSRALALGELGYAVVASPGFLSRGPSFSSPSDIPERDRLAYLTTGGNRMPWSFLGKKSLQPGARLVSDDGGALRTAALNGAGVAYLFRFAVEADLRSGALVELFSDLPKPGIDVVALHPFASGPPPRVQAFLDYARQRIAGLGSSQDAAAAQAQVPGGGAARTRRR